MRGYDFTGGVGGEALLARIQLQRLKSCYSQLTIIPDGMDLAAHDYLIKAASPIAKALHPEIFREDGNLVVQKWIESCHTDLSKW